MAGATGLFDNELKGVLIAVGPDLPDLLNMPRCRAFLPERAA